MNNFKVIGVMSGTSLDGVDIVQANFEQSEGNWHFAIQESKTFAYSREWKNILSNVNYNTPAFEFVKLDQEYGIYLGNLIKKFINEGNDSPQLIASHGHTIFHQPGKGITTQIGNGNNIAAITGLPVVFDLRSKDVALHGHGAPLVPFGDKYLFSEYKYCLNLGGFANISIKENNHVTAFDICPVNIVVNEIVNDLDLEFDKDGLIGKSGEVNYDLLQQLNDLSFYRQKGPKSLGKEWLEANFIPVLYDFNIPLKDKIRTIYSHVTQQIHNSIQEDDASILVTGGGAHNTFLIELLKAEMKQVVVVPSDEIVNFKEALVFAFLGLMRWLGRENVLASVTGADKDSVGGNLVL